jgi:hypothetical protein
MNATRFQAAAELLRNWLMVRVTAGLDLLQSGFREAIITGS